MTSKTLHSRQAIPDSSQAATPKSSVLSLLRATRHAWQYFLHSWQQPQSPSVFGLSSDAAKFKQLAAEAHKLKQAKKQARKERRKAAAPKPVDDATARLAEHRARVSKQERELQRAKAEQQRAELAAKRKLMHRERGVKEEASPSSCDPDEGQHCIDAKCIFAVKLHTFYITSDTVPIQFCNHL